MIPLKDDIPGERFPAVTVGLIGVNVLVFLWEVLGGGQGNFERVIRSYGAVPWEVTHLTDVWPYGVVPVPLTVVSSMFLHGGVAHILGNMLYLWIFGNNVEDAMGTVKFVVFYVVCGIAAAMTQVALTPNSHVPLVGASGAIAGVLGAYLVLYPRARVLTLVPIFYFVRLIYLPAVVFLGLWFVLQLISVPGSLRGGGGVAFLAHVGGFVAGLVLVKLFARPVRRHRPAYYYDDG